MAVRCIETGVVYPSAAAAARSVGVTAGAITHHLKGRQKTCGGHTFEIVSDVNMRIVRRMRIIRDDAGNVYRSYKDLATAKGISQNKAYRWFNSSPDGVFRNAWLRESVRRIEFGFDGCHWCVGASRFATRNDAVRYVRRLAKHLPVMKAHVALDKARRKCKTVAMFFGDCGWTEDKHSGDLFSEME